MDSKASMKKALAAILVASIAAVAVIGCSGGGENTQDVEQKAPTNMESVGAPVGAGGGPGEAPQTAPGMGSEPSGSKPKAPPPDNASRTR